mgnify:CR=1 FL=1
MEDPLLQAVQKKIHKLEKQKKYRNLLDKEERELSAYKDLEAARIRDLGYIQISTAG